MKINSIIYSINQGIKNIYRNKMFSMASILVMAISIFLFGLFFSITLNLTHNIKRAEEDIPIVVFFKENVKDAERNKFKKDLKSNKKIKRIEYVSGAKSWNDFKNKYFKDTPELIKEFEKDNPLINSDHFNIYLKKTKYQSLIVKNLKENEYVRKVKASKMASNIINNFNILFGYATITIILFLLAVAIFLITNTITIGILVRKKEIEIMRYIGATSRFIKAPFIIEGIVISILGSCIPLGLLYFLYEKTIKFIRNKFVILSGMIDFLDVNVIFKYMLPICICLSFGIGIICSNIALKKYLKR